MENSSGAFTDGGPIKLWLPGQGVVDLRVRKVMKAVEEYDAAFRLARHELTGDWVVVIGERGHPVFGFGKELPDPRDVERLLGKHDMKRNAKRIMGQLADEAERKRLDARYRAEEQNGQLAEALEHGFRKQGKHPTTRVFIPRSIPR